MRKSAREGGGVRDKLPGDDDHGMETLSLEGRR